MDLRSRRRCNANRRNLRSSLSVLLLAGMAAWQSGCAGLVGANSSGGGPPPALAITSPTASAESTTKVNVSWATNLPATSQVEYGTTTNYGSSTAVDSTMVTNHQASASSLKAGTLYHVRIHSHDASNNEAVSSDLTVTTSADATAPTVSISSPNANATLSGTVTVTANASDDVAVAGVQIKVDNANYGAELTAAPFTRNLDTKSFSNGNHVLTAVARDAAGHSTTSAQVSVKVDNTAPPDTTAPTVSITSPANSATVSATITISSSASDNVGIAGVQFKVDGNNIGSEDTASPYSASLDTKTLSNGSHVLTAVARDASNNSATSANVTVNVNNTTADTTAPTVSISSPANGASVSSSITVSANASDNVGIASVQFQLDGANLGSLDTVSPYSVSWSTSSASNGSHTLRAIAKDAAANSTTSASVTVTVSNTTPDTTAPTVSISSPANGASVSGTITVSANASDNVGVASVQFQLDGANLGSLDTVSPYSVSWSTTSASNGSHTLRAIAKDAAANSATSASITVTVNNTVTDITPPTVSISSPAGGSTVSGTITVGANASDNVGVASVQFQLDGANLGSLDTASPYSVSWNTTTSSNGSHTVRAIAKDAAGNSTTSAAVTVTVSNVAPPPPGGAVTSFQLSSPLGGTLPFTVGLGFKKGDVPTNAVMDTVVGGQVIVKSTWLDGSAKTAIASGRIALTANVAKVVNVLPGTPAGGTNLTCTDIQNAAPAASVQMGSIGTVNLSSLLATPFRTWVSGPEMVECHYRASVGADATLVVWFHVRRYADGRMFVRAIGQNGYLDVATSDKSYVPTVIIGGTTVYNNGGASLSHYGHTRWSADGWIGGDPQVTPKHNTIYLEATKLVPNYMNLTPSAASLNGLTQTYSPMQNADWSVDMGSTGFQSQIGLLPQWDAIFVSSGGDSRAYNSVLANAKALNSYGIVRNDSATHLPTRPSDRPTWSYAGNNGGGATSVGAGTLSYDIAHHGSGGYLAYLITGDYYYLETLENAASMCYLMDSSTHGSGTSRDITGVVQDRGTAWCTRTLSQLAGIAPTGDTIGSDYRAWLSNIVTNQLLVTINQPSQNLLGYFLEYEASGGAYSATLAVLAPWQEHFMIQSLGLGSDLEPLTSMTNYNAVRDWSYRAIVGILGPNGSTNYCFTDAAAYNLQVGDAVSNSPGWYDDWGTVWSKNHAGSPNTACANTLQGTSGGDPANAATGYWGNLMPAIAYAKDHGATGAAESWTRLTGATNWNTVLNSGFGNISNWGVVPRSVSTTPPPPTVSVTSPASSATVSGTISVTASASSSVGVAGVQFQVDGANVGTEDTSAPYSISWNTTTVADGTHFLTAVARDTQSTLAVSSSVSVTVANVLVVTPPVISAIASAPTTTGVTITWTTDKPADSQVEYGTSSSYGQSSPLNTSLVAAHTVTISGLASSTTYQFRVKSTDGGGNPAVSNNFSFTTTAPSSGGGIPSALGWYQIPNSSLAPNCPNDPTVSGVTGCVSVIIAWSGGIADTTRNRMIIWGGGHNDYYGNELYSMDLNTLAMSRITNPTTNPVHCVETQPDGRPSSRHTYDNLSYIAHADKMFSFGGGPGCDNPSSSDATWTIGLSTLQWQRMDPATGGKPNGQLGLSASDYDPVTKKVFVEDGFSLWTYDVDTNTYQQVNSGAQIWDGTGGVVDPVRRLFMIFGAGKARAFSIATGSSYAMQNWDSALTGCSGLTGDWYPGLTYDSKQNLIVGWAGGDTVYLFNPDTKTCTTKTFTGGPGAAQSNGTNGRFAYYPALNLFLVVNGWQQNAYSLRLTP